MEKSKILRKQINYNIGYSDKDLDAMLNVLKLSKPMQACLNLDPNNKVHRRIHYNEILEFEDKYVFTSKCKELRYSERNGFFPKTTTHFGMTLKKKGSTISRLTLWKGSKIHEALNHAIEFSEFIGGPNNDVIEIVTSYPYNVFIKKGSLSALLSKNYSLNDVFQHYARYCVPELKIEKDNIDCFIDFIFQSKDIVHNAYSAIELLRISENPNHVITHYKTAKQVEELWLKYNKIGCNFTQIKSVCLKIDWKTVDTTNLGKKIISKLQGLQKIARFWTKEYHLTDDFESLPF
jgi:hypothetical protein